MTKATFTTLLSKSIRNEYGNQYLISLIHRTAGEIAQGAAIVQGKETWLVRVQQPGQSTFHGQQFGDKLAALDNYNARVGTAIDLGAAS